MQGKMGKHNSGSFLAAASMNESRRTVLKAIVKFSLKSALSGVAASRNSLAACTFTNSPPRILTTSQILEKIQSRILIEF